MKEPAYITICFPSNDSQKLVEIYTDRVVLQHEDNQDVFIIKEHNKYAKIVEACQNYLRHSKDMKFENKKRRDR